MQKWFATFFGFNRSELNGVCALILLLLILWGALRVFPLRRNMPAYDISRQAAEIDRFLITLHESTTAANHHGGAPESRGGRILTDEVTLFPFDPNGLSIEDWQRLGLSERQAQVIKNYEAKGGRFRKKEDLRKMYTLSDADYARLEPYIEIKETVDDGGRKSMTAFATRQSAAAPAAEEQRLHLDLNEADSLELQYLPGIGPVFASRIVRFRERLGGFHHVEQLMQVYGFDTARFEGLEAHVYVDTAKVRKIPLNKADYQHFRDHPLITHKLANAIVQYRKQHGSYASIGDLLNIAIVDEQILLKIAPYLTLTDD
ncbi:ComEA family DNA-binding protein [Parapedobacter soli]|uniref:ComEA family DNA-binding protein n=1 Tax=Parapedobacter soli TaxID=416955 RepID=UPI0021C81650|nr:helix-hairpin-helix domain-containing protein [Parapedobacter soli]